MICYRNLGKKSEALLVYQRCRKTLSSVLEIEPSGETQAIYNAILSEKIKTLPEKIEKTSKSR
jgi:DNA-binding SARP family transcriptional activator